MADPGFFFAAAKTTQPQPPLNMVLGGMNLFAKILRSVKSSLFAIRGHKTIYPIETPSLNKILEELAESGWVKTSEYDGVDAWIDYASVVLRRRKDKLFIEWDNWNEGSIEGKRDLLVPIAKKNNLEIVDYWRWSTWDSASGK